VNVYVHAVNQPGRLTSYGGTVFLQVCVAESGSWPLEMTSTLRPVGLLARRQHHVSYLALYPVYTYEAHLEQP